VLYSDAFTYYTQEIDQAFSCSIHRALAAAIRQVPPDWKRQIGRRSHTWLCTCNWGRPWPSELWRRDCLEKGHYSRWMATWTQQRSSGVRYERKKVEVESISTRMSAAHCRLFFWHLRWIKSVTIITSDKGGKCFCPCSFVCLSVCLLARLLKNACIVLDEMLRVDRCRDMDELINFW